VDIGKSMIKPPESSPSEPAQPQTTPNPQQTILRKFLTVIDSPFHVLAYLTILPVSQADYTLQRAMVWPFFGVQFMIFTFVQDFTSQWYIRVGAPLTALVYMVFILVLNDKFLAKIYWVFTVQGMLAGLMWSYLLITILVDVLNSVGILLNLDKTYLGLTVLALGNAVPTF
jgi:sodium/potassium/calcium exchanger 6